MAATGRILVVLLKRERTDAPDDGCGGRDDAYHVGAALALAPRTKSAGKLLSRSSGLVLAICGQCSLGEAV